MQVDVDNLLYVMMMMMTIMMMVMMIMMMRIRMTKINTMIMMVNDFETMILVLKMTFIISFIMYVIFLAQICKNKNEE